MSRSPPRGSRRAHPPYVHSPPSRVIALHLRTARAIHVHPHPPCLSHHPRLEVPVVRTARWLPIRIPGPTSRRSPSQRSFENVVVLDVVRVQRTPISESLRIPLTLPQRAPPHSHCPLSALRAPAPEARHRRVENPHPRPRARLEVPIVVVVPSAHTHLALRYVVLLASSASSSPIPASPRTRRRPRLAGREQKAGPRRRVSTTVSARDPFDACAGLEDAGAGSRRRALARYVLPRSSCGEKEDVKQGEGRRGRDTNDTDTSAGTAHMEADGSRHKQRHGHPAILAAMTMRRRMTIRQGTNMRDHDM
ncbi:hypothetical protein C8R45DRAFT_1209314 [Mycena sanguinolenta]|nr:hypothetical protein C8R45DRAFT_1209314 [Mycena sanguinolenta]